MELVDKTDLKSVGGDTVGVRVPSVAPIHGFLLHKWQSGKTLDSGTDYIILRIGVAVARQTLTL